MFRIAQEALTNVGRHAGASEVRIRLRPAGEYLHLSVIDNGVGIAQSKVERGLGLAGMRARARAAGGEVLVRPGPGGKGVAILLGVPLAKVAA